MSGLIVGVRLPPCSTNPSYPNQRDFMSTTESTPDASLSKDARDGEFSHRVEFQKVDNEKQIATGAVLVPDRVDHQGDFFRSKTIKSIANDFSGRVESGDAIPGVMHAVFPDNIKLHESRVLDSEETLGEKTLPAGTWVQSWKMNDPKLWGLVKDGVLGGYSIGGTAKGRWYDPGAAPEDVTFPDSVKNAMDKQGVSPDEVMVREITDGRVLETSSVDFPAVPDATIESTKSLAKGNSALTSSVVDARLYLENRGHSEEDAKRLAEYLIENKAQEDEGWIARAKKFFSGGDTETATDDATEAEKAGRTLSKENVDSAMAVHDAAIDLLNRSDVSHDKTRFSDSSDHEFHIKDYGGDASGNAKSDELAESSAGSPNDNTDMSEEDLSKTLESIAKSQEQTAERLSELEEKFADEETEATEEEKAGDEPSELEQALKAQSEQIASLTETVGKMAEAQGHSQQGDTTDTNKSAKTFDASNSPFAPAFNGGGE